jgi:hypothetical protein
VKDAHDVRSGENDTEFECDLPGVGAWGQFTILNRHAGFAPE